jgi:hypothetical protein
MRGPRPAVAWLVDRMRPLGLLTLGLRVVAQVSGMPWNWE